jgi:hypothetical protein
MSKLTPAVFYSFNQRHLYDRLIEHCYALDGTKIKKVIAPEPKVGYPAVCNVAFRTVCEAMKGKPFVWLEADSIPTQPGWLKKLEEEWEVAKAFGKSILWTNDSNPPHDLCTGIGVYGPDALSLVPEGLDDDGFDGYILKNHADKIHKTPLIQHSYGDYNSKGDVTLVRQPKVRENAVIFHKDQFQDLISVEKHFGSSGDLGDIIYLLPLIEAAGGGYLWLYDRPWTKNLSSRYPIIEPLLAAQPYIKAVGLGNGRGVQYDMATFRSVYRPDRTLTASQGEHGRKSYGLPVVKGDKKWIHVTPSPETKGRVVIARSARYHNSLFPWKRILAHYGNSILFVGIKEEHDAFCRAFGNVEHRPTSDFLELAQLIAGSDLFIGNQSSPYAVAEGLKHPRILECNLRVPDCIYPNGGQVCYDGHLDFLPAAGGKQTEFFPRVPKYKKEAWSVCPPGKWQYPGFRPQNDISAMAQMVAREKQVKAPEARDLIYRHNCERLPDFFTEKHDGQFERVLKALSNAQ